MWKVLLADDEPVIVKGLRKLVDWEALNVQIVAEATDGAMAEELIRTHHLDLVVSDIRMPNMTGLELLERFPSGSASPKFIFVSGFEEFEYARQALAGGAVDYLLKPVSVQALEKAVRKALGMMEDKKAASLLRQDSVPLKEFFDQLTANREFAADGLYENFAALLGGKEHPVFMGMCFGLSRASEQELSEMTYEHRLLQTFMAFNAIRDELEHNGYGCFLRKDNEHCCVLGMFSPEECPERIITDALDKAATKTGVHLRVGLGRASENPDDLFATYEDALAAYDLFYFEEGDLVHWDGSVHTPSVTNEDFDEAERQVFKSIVAKSETVMEQIDRVVDVVADLHYGNRTAAYNRVMMFTGDLCQQMYANRLLTGSFRDRQDALQGDLEGCATFGELREHLKSYYWDLLPDIYDTAQKKNTGEVLRVQQYIEEHYFEELSLKTLAEIACVSPHYFSAYFKSQTGQNYKAYLTRVRMDHAIHLVLDTDLKTYEIAEKVGYSNVRRFVDAFRDAYELSPTDYRKLHGGT